MKGEISRLRAELAKSNRVNGSRSNESRRIRNRLRYLGHYGGLKGKKQPNFALA